MVLLSECEACERMAACVHNMETRMGETAQCCRCRQANEDDGFCDECRPDPPPQKDLTRDKA